jgi:hypothetical protein
VQTLDFRVVNTLGGIQRMAGLFSRRGLTLQELWFRDEGDGTAFACLRFQGDEKLKNSMERQVRKMLDFLSEGA